jgi:hypothetical protein
LPRLAPPPIQLNKTEREQLQQLVNRHSTPQQIALRASIIRPLAKVAPGVRSGVKLCDRSPLLITIAYFNRSEASLSS